MEMKVIHIKVDIITHAKIKISAAHHNMTMKQLLLECFEKVMKEEKRNENF